VEAAKKGELTGAQKEILAMGHTYSPSTHRRFELKELRRRQDEELERQRQEEIARHSADRPDGADRRSETGSIRSGRQPQEPLVRKSSQPKKSPVVAEAPPVEPEPAGAAAVVPPPVIEQSPPVTSPEVGTDSEAGGKGKFHLLVVENSFP